MNREMKDSGIEWANVIPSEWTVLSFSKFSKHNTGKALNASDIQGELKQYITTSNLYWGYFSLDSISEMLFTDSEVEKCTARKGDLLICEGGYIGRSAIWEYDESICLQNHIHRVRTFDNVSTKFIYYCMYAFVETGAIRVLDKGIGIQGMSTKTLASIRLPIPPLDEQKAIADFLDDKCGKIDALISAEEQAIIELRDYKNQLAVKLTTKGVRKTILKQSGVDWIGETPEHWQVLPLFAVFKEHKNKNIGMQESNLLSLSFGNIIRKDINAEGGLLPENFEGYNIVESGDIVLRLTDLQNDQRSLRTGLVKEKGIITSAYVTIRNHKDLNSIYLRYLLHSADICKIFYNLGNGIRQNLTFEGLKRLDLILPPRKEQDEIVEMLNKKYTETDNLIALKQQKIAELKEYKKSLIYEYVTGKKQPPQGEK